MPTLFESLSEWAQTPSPRKFHERQREIAGHIDRLDTLRKLTAWMTGCGPYAPAAWVARQTGVSREAVTGAVRRGLCRAEKFQLADGTWVMLVNINDAAKIGPRPRKATKRKIARGWRRKAATRGTAVGGTPKRRTRQKGSKARSSPSRALTRPKQGKKRGRKGLHSRVKSPRPRP